VEKTKYLIVGNGPAGSSAAEVIRSRDPSGSIMIVDREGERLYSKLLLHKFIIGEVPEQRLYLHKENWLRDHKIILETDGIDSITAGVVKLKSGREVKFEKILFSSGAAARKLGLEGEDLEGVYDFRNLADARGVESGLGTAQNISIVGGGLISTDLIDALVGTGKKINLILRDKEFLWGKVNEKAGRYLEQILLDAGVIIFKENEVSKVSGNTGKIEKIKLLSGEEIASDMLLIAVGIVSNFDYLAGSQIEKNKGILVDEYLQTSEDWTWAAGDVCEHPVQGFNEKIVSGNWLYALESGKIAGENMAGEHKQCWSLPVSVKSLRGVSIGYYGDVLAESETVDAEKEDVFYRFFVKDSKLCSASIVGSQKNSAVIRSAIGKEFSTL